MIQVSKRPAKFGLKNFEYNLENCENNVDIKNKSKYTERDLHILLTKFVYSNQHFRCYTKTIYHEKSKKRIQELINGYIQI